MAEPARKSSPPVLLTSAEAAGVLRITASALRDLIAKGKLVPDHRGGRPGGLRGHRFTVETLNAFLKGASK